MNRTLPKLNFLLLVMSFTLTSCEVKDAAKRDQEFTGPGFSQIDGYYYTEFLALPSFRAKVESVTLDEDNSKGRPYLFVALLKENGEEVGLCELSPSASLREAVSKLKIGESYHFPNEVRIRDIPHSKGRIDLED